MFNRVIPTLLLSEGGIVKGQKFKNHKYVGDPINVAKIFNDKEVDELIVLDIAASRKREAPNIRLLEMLASECFMPVCYGGGISDYDQASAIFDVGIEKICLQTAVLGAKHLIYEVASVFGSQSVAVSVDVDTSFLGKHRLYHASTGRSLSTPWQEHAKACIDEGAGELLVTSVKHEGRLSGMDTGLVEQAARISSVPVVAGGGISSVEDISEAIRVGASAVAVGAFFIFHGPHRAVLINVPKREIIEDKWREV